MKFKTLTFNFPHPLTDEQEIEVIATFQSIRNGIRQRMKLAKRMSNNFVFKKIAGAAGEVTQMIANRIDENLDTYIQLESADRQNYILKIAWEEFGSLDTALTAHNKKYWEKVRDKFTSSGFKAQICQRTRFPRDMLKITEGEAEDIDSV